MNELDNPQVGPEADNPQADPSEQDISSLLPEAEDDPPNESNDPEDSPEGDDPEQEPEESKTEAKQLADDAEYTLPDGRKVTVGEMAKSFAAFTQKTQELAAERQQVRAEALQAVAETRKAQAEQFSLVAQHITQLVAPGVTEQALYQLAQQDPEAYFQQKARLDAAQNFVAQISQHAKQLQAQAEQARQLAQQEELQFRAQRMQEASSALSAESWFTPDFGNKAMAYLKSSGFPPDVIQAINDGMGGAAAVHLVRKAMLYDEAQKQRKTAKQPPIQSKTTPSAKPAQGLMGKAKQSQQLFEAGRKGDKRAAGRWLSQNLPDA